MIFTATRLADAVYVPHAFQKKTQALAKRDIDFATARGRRVHLELEAA